MIQAKKGPGAPTGCVDVDWRFSREHGAAKTISPRLAEAALVAKAGLLSGRVLGGLGSTTIACQDPPRHQSMNESGWALAPHRVEAEERNRKIRNKEDGEGRA